MTRKVLISIDERLLGRVDAVAKERGLTRSGFIAELAQREVGGIRRSPEERRQIEDAFEQLRELGRRNYTGGDVSSAAIVRAERDAH